MTANWDAIRFWTKLYGCRLFYGGRYVKVPFLIYWRKTGWWSKANFKTLHMFKDLWHFVYFEGNVWFRHVVQFFVFFYLKTLSNLTFSFISSKDKKCVKAILKFLRKTNIVFFCNTFQQTIRMTMATYTGYLTNMRQN